MSLLNGLQLLSCVLESLLDPDPAMSDSFLDTPFLLVSAAYPCYQSWLKILTKVLPSDFVPWCRDFADPCLSLTWTLIVTLYLTPCFCLSDLSISKLKFVDPTPWHLRPFRCPSSSCLYHQGCLEGNCASGQPHQLVLH